MGTKGWMEVVAAIVMLVGLIGTFAIRLRLRKGIGRRAIQAMTVILVVPATLILALEGVLTSETTAAILGGVAGYALSGIAGKATEE